MAYLVFKPGHQIVPGLWAFIEEETYLASNAPRYPRAKSAIFLLGNIQDPLTISKKLAAPQRGYGAE